MSLRALILALLGAALVLPAAAGVAKTALLPPETTITSGPAPLVTTASATFAFTASESQARFACALDSGAFFDCVSPYTLSVPDGDHRFYVVAVVNDVSDPTPAVWTWTVDTTPPSPVKERIAVRYRHFALTWGSLSRTGAARVVVRLSTDPKKAPAREVYRGSGSSYVDTKFANGVYHRYRITSWDKAGNASPPVGVTVTPGALLLSPKEGARLRAPTMLRWRPVPKASFYNVQLWRGGKKVLSVWPRVPHVKMTRAWKYLGHAFGLKAGHYTWLVWPGFGPLAKARYGGLLGQGSFDVVG